MFLRCFSSGILKSCSERLERKDLSVEPNPRTREHANSVSKRMLTDLICISRPWRLVESYDPPEAVLKLCRYVPCFHYPSRLLRLVNRIGACCRTCRWRAADIDRSFASR